MRYQFKNEISENKSSKKIVLGCLFGLFIEIFMLLMYYPLWVSLFFALIIGLFVGTSLIDDFKKIKVLYWVGPFFSFLLIEYIIGNFSLYPLAFKFVSLKYYLKIFLGMSFFQMLLNLVWYYIFSGFIYMIFRRYKIATFITVTIFFVIGQIEFYVFQFAGRVIFPSDIFGIRTALNVLDNYTFEFSDTQLISGIIYLIFVLILVLQPKQDEKRKLKSTQILSSIMLSVILVFTFFYTPALDVYGRQIGITDSMWITRRNGVVLNFMINLRYNIVKEPYGYSVEKIRDLSIKEIETYDISNRVVGSKPNIIVIMNESFSDLSVLGNVSTNQDYMPFINSLSDNAVKGIAHSSVFGGQTANSEYEFITGNTMKFFPNGTVPFNLYVEKDDYSLAGQLKDCGYSTIFVHAYKDSGWNRKTVYNNFGFDSIIFEDDFKNKKYIRNYISDESNYDELIRLFEENESEKPLFIYNVTMQNHGGYTPLWDDISDPILLDNELKGKFEKTDFYLSLIKESDSAFKKLISYFKNVDQPTVVMMFGDHQPNLGDEFYEAVFNKSTEDFLIDEYEKKYQVPFIIWANYEIDEADDIDVSINYLSPMLLDIAGLDLTSYQIFLKELYNEMPVITNIAIVDKYGEYINDDIELSKSIQKKLEEYHYLQYNGIFDDKSRIDDIFFLK